MMANISTLVNVKWFLGTPCGRSLLLRRADIRRLGVPFNDTENIHMEIVEQGQRILGDNLLGLQVGNEPDLYAQCVPFIVLSVSHLIVLRHSHRPSYYNATSYYLEFGEWADIWNSDSNVPQKKTMIGPSLALANWPLEDVWNTPFLTTYDSNLYALSVERSEPCL